MEEEKDIRCGNCGICCVIPGTNKDCKHLIRLKNRTLCRIYKSRLGTKIGEMIVDGKKCDVRCVMRESVTTNYPSCPFNKEKE